MLTFAERLLSTDGNPCDLCWFLRAHVLAIRSFPEIVETSGGGEILNSLYLEEEEDFLGGSPPPFCERDLRTFRAFSKPLERGKNVDKRVFPLPLPPLS